MAFYFRTAGFFKTDQWLFCTGLCTKRVRADLRQKGDFSRVHPLPHSGQDVPDDMDARLVVIGTEYPHSRGGDSPALQQARAILESRGTSPRIYRNTLVFLAADATRLQELDEAVRRFLAWESIIGEQEQLNLVPQQVRQAETQREVAATEATTRIPETYRWLLVPGQSDTHGAASWEPLNLSGADPLAVRASRRLRAQDGLMTAYAATLLRMELDRVPLWRGDHVSVSQLAEDFARYLYLPRLKGPEVLLRTIVDGVSLITWEQETFAYAESFDEDAKRYRALRVQDRINLPDASAPGLLVKPAAARQQLDAEVSPAPNGGGNGSGGAGPGGRVVAPDPPPPPVPEKLMKRFHGTVDLDATRVGRDASQIADEVIAHLAGLVGANVTVTLEIEAEIPNGAPENVVRTVTENSHTLKFTNQAFERE